MIQNLRFMLQADTFTNLIEGIILTALFSFYRLHSLRGK
jgi:hypothetical protein